MVVRGEVPASKSGGTLVVSVEMKRRSEPVWLRNVGSHFSGEGELAGLSAPFEPVLGKATYPAPWQAWRLAVAPSASPQAFELTISAMVSPDVELSCEAHFVPD